MVVKPSISSVVLGFNSYVEDTILIVVVSDGVDNFVISVDITSREVVL